jgi:hypothetical protein
VYGDTFVFCSVACIDAGPLVLSSDLLKAAGKVRKGQLKLFLRSKEQRLVDESGKDVPKSVLIAAHVNYSNRLIQSNKECVRIRTKSHHIVTSGS